MFKLKSNSVELYKTLSPSFTPSLFHHRILFLNAISLYNVGDHNLFTDSVSLSSWNCRDLSKKVVLHSVAFPTAFSNFSSQLVVTQGERNESTSLSFFPRVLVQKLMQFEPGSQIPLSTPITVTPPAYLSCDLLVIINEI